MKIFVAGGAGFIGSAFVRRLHQQGGHQIVNFDALTYAVHPEALSGVLEGEDYRFVKGDVTHYDDLEDSLVGFLPDIVINFAAETHVDRSISAPADFVSTNILGTANLLRACSEMLKVRENTISNFKYIQVSTDEVFGDLDAKEPPFDESSVIRPSSPYSASKASADMLVNAWVRTYGFPAIISRCSNNFGPFQNGEKLIPTIINNILSGNSIPVYGDGKQIRDWLYVDDHVEALQLIVEQGVIGSTYNIGGDNEMTNISIIELIIDLICEIYHNDRERLTKRTKYRELISHVSDRLGHDLRYAINSQKIRSELGWKPRNKLEYNLKTTIQWFFNRP